MFIPCIKGGLVVDASKCAPSGEHDLEMFITPKLSLKFYDIYDCKSQTQLSISNLVLNGLKIKQEKYKSRLDFFKKHKKALINKAVSDEEDTSVFFDSIECEAIEKLLTDNKFSAKVEIIFDGEAITLKELKEKSKRDFENVTFFIREMNMVEMVDVTEYEQIVNKVRFPHKPKLIDIGLGFVAGVAVSILARKIIKKLGGKR